MKILICTLFVAFLTSACTAVIPHEHDWREHGVQVVKGTEMHIAAQQTEGMTRAEAISNATAGAEKLWAGSATLHPDAKSGPHHHGELESVIYVVSGESRTRWGDKLEFVMDAGPGDFIFVPPYCPHQEINASKTEPLVIVVVRSDQQPVVVNLDIASPEPVSEIEWRDQQHPHQTANN